MRYFKLKVKKFVPNNFWEFLVIIKKFLFVSDWQQLQVKSKKIQSVYIIRRRPPGAGLFANVKHVLEGLIHANEHGYIPVVDMKNYPTEYSSLWKFNGTRNAWEYFFEPVSNMTLKEAYASESLILSAGDRILSEHPTSGRNLNFVFDNNVMSNLHSLYKEKIRLNSFTINFIEDVINFIGINKNKSLGVFFRGDKRYGGSGHTRQPRLEDVIEDVKSFLSEHQIQSIFLATDTQNTRDMFDLEFGNLVHKNFREEFNQNNSSAIKFFSRYNIPSTEISTALGYLAEIYISASLAYNIASLTNGSAFIHIINGGVFKDSKLYNLGTF